MSTNIGEVYDMRLPNMGRGQHDCMSVTRFAAGSGTFGYQFTIGGEFVQLDNAETERLIAMLRDRATLGDFEEAAPSGEREGGTD